MMTSEKIDKAFVRKWAGHYGKHVDDHVLGVVHPAVRDRGYFTVAD